MYRLLFLVLLIPVGICRADSEIIKFNVFLDDREVGQHNFTLIEDGSGLHVTSVVSMDFKVLLVKKIKYRHLAKEIWRDGCLQSVESSTQRNNKHFTISAKITAGNFVVTKAGVDVSLNGCIKSFAYWRPEWLENEFLLNVETGQYTPITLGSQQDSSTGIMHKTLGLPKSEIHLQYSGSGVWQSLESDVKVVGKLRYKRVYEVEGESNASL